MLIFLRRRQILYFTHAKYCAQITDRASPSQATTTAAAVAALVLVTAISRTTACPWALADWLNADVFVRTEKSGDQRCLMDLMRTARFLYLKARSKAKFSTVGLRWIGRTLSMHLFISSIIILRPLSWGIKRCFYLTSDVCLSCTFTLSREHRGLGRLKLAQK